MFPSIQYSGFTPKKTSVTCYLWCTAKKGVSLSGSSVTQWNDQSGNGFNLAPFNTSPTYSATGLNNLPSITFNGTNDNLGKIGLTGGSHTKFSFWGVFYPLAYTNNHTLWYSPTTAGWAGNTNDLYFEDGGSGIQGLDFWQIGVAAKAPTAAHAFNNNTPYDVVGTYDNTTLKIYINGRLASSQAVANGKIGDRIALGGLQPGYSGFGWNGQISEIAFYSDVLSAADIASLHKYAQYQWFPVWQNDKASFYFDGSSYLDAGTNIWNYDYNQDFTISAWICPDSGIVIKSSIIGCEQGSGAFRGLDFLREDDGRLGLYFTNAWSTNTLYANSTGVVAGNGTDWTHVAVTYNGSAGSNAAHTKFYINGVQDTTTSQQNSLSATILDPTLHTYIGNAWNTSIMQGKMQEIAVFGAALSSGAITTLYNKGIPFDLTGQSNLAHYWHCGSGTDTLTTIYDQVGSWNLTTNGTGKFSSSVPLPLP